MAVAAMNPGVEVKRFSMRPQMPSISINEWKNNLGSAGMWHTPFTDPGWMGGSFTFYFADASYIHIKL